LVLRRPEAAAELPSRTTLVTSDASRWMRWLLTTHGHRHHLGRESSDRVWQGQFKAFPIQQDVSLLTVMRYDECHPLRAGLVQRAEDWA